MKRTLMVSVVLGLGLAYLLVSLILRVVFAGLDVLSTGQRRAEMGNTGFYIPRPEEISRVESFGTNSGTVELWIVDEPKCKDFSWIPNLVNQMPAGFYWERTIVIQRSETASLGAWRGDEQIAADGTTITSAWLTDIYLNSENECQTSEFTLKKELVGSSYALLWNVLNQSVVNASTNKHQRIVLYEGLGLEYAAGLWDGVSTVECGHLQVAHIMSVHGVLLSGYEWIGGLQTEPGGLESILHSYGCSTPNY